ncbi:MAG: hypothetical protein R6W70_05890 [bacterium]
MASYVNISYGKSKSRWFSEIFLLRRARAKADVFSLKMFAVMLMVFITAALLLLCSFLKSYERMQLVDMRRKIERNRDTQFVRNEMQETYYRIVSDKSLMEHAEEKDLRVVTREQLLSLK